VEFNTKLVVRVRIGKEDWHDNTSNGPRLSTNYFERYICFDFVETLESGTVCYWDGVIQFLSVKLLRNQDILDW
jgi:hypothetical protein